MTIPTAKPARRGKWRWILIAFFILIVVPVGGMAAWTWLTLNMSYSSGERVGYVQKISKKGWVCKTWEGELAMVNLPGTAPQIFSFSVRDDKVAQQLEDAAGKRVALDYEQHRGVPSACFGETEYFITKVRPVGQ
jgi:hypothetical protein